jgi:coenzyme F420-reducing hydrogenase alpha subunit
MPSFRRDMRFVAMRHPREYPFNEGRIVSSDGLDLPLTDWTKAFEEFQVEGTNALHARAKDGSGPYLLGPAARVTLCADQLHPVARALLEETGMQEMIRTNIYASIVARAVELVHATAEALDLIAAYRPPVAPMVPWQPRAGVAAWATEAPRGLCFHRYETDDAGRVLRCQIVPPTSQNQAAIEADLVHAAGDALQLPDAEATQRLEQMIRSYDPCISCATHFLDLSIEYDGEGPATGGSRS